MEIKETRQRWIVAVHVKLMICIALLCLASNISTALDTNYQSLYQTDFKNGIDNKLMLQQPNSNAIKVAIAPCEPSQPAVRIEINKQDNYLHVANGAPRAEISFANVFNFMTGQEYIVEWSTCIPADFKFDNQQPEGITQIHEGQAQGSPPFGLALVHGNYQVELRNGKDTQTFNLGNAANDRGQWVHWKLYYSPDASGTYAVTELLKNGVNVAMINGQPNSYPNDNRSYFKIGIYKWWWQQRPSDVEKRVMYFGDVRVAFK